MQETAPKPTRGDTVGWPAEVAARYVAKGYWQGRSLGALLARRARAAPEAVCLVDGDVRITYGDLLARADGAAVRMRAMGLRAGDRVVVQLPNCWEHVVLTVACLRLAVLPVWTLPQHRHHEMTGVTAHAGARAIVVPTTYRGFDHEAMAHAIVESVPAAEFVLVAGSGADPRSIDLGTLLAPADDVDEKSVELDAVAPGGEAVALLLLSGGTTGIPKLIPRTHNDLAYMIGRAAEVCEFGPSTVYLAALPLGHGFPNTGPGVLGALLTGGRVVVGGSPAPEAAFAAIEREGVTATSVAPAIVRRWLDHRARHPEVDLTSLRLLQVGAARLAPEVAAEIRPVLGCTPQQVYGMGEGLLCLTRPDDPPEVVLHTQGRPICPDDEVLVVDGNGSPLPPGAPGLLLTRGPYTIRGYYRSPELDAHAFVGDGWYRTGDVVRRTAEGNLVVEGREKDLVNRGGEKISAGEVEEFAARVPGVGQVAAVAMPHPELGEAVCLFVVPVPGHQVDIADVRAAMVGAGLARFKLPERLITVDSLPVTGVGKVDKMALRAEVAQRITAEHNSIHEDVTR